MGMGTLSRMFARLNVSHIILLIEVASSSCLGSFWGSILTEKSPLFAFSTTFDISSSIFQSLSVADCHIFEMSFNIPHHIPFISKQ